MKRTCAIILLFALLLGLAGCRSKTKEPADTDDTTTQDTTETVPPTSITDDEFATVTIINGVILKPGDVASFARTWEGTEYRSSKTSVVTVDQDGNIKAIGAGTAMVVAKSTAEERSSATVYCVLGEGEQTDPSAAAPQLHEVGSTYIMSADVSSATYVSSNTEILEADANGTLHFLKPGYAVLTVASASVPRIFSFIVYDRTVEAEK